MSQLPAGKNTCSASREENPNVHAADVLVDAIHDWGVRVVFGMPGDGINGLVEAFRRRRGSQTVRAGAAQGSSRTGGVVTPSSRVPSACASRHQDRGALHLLNGLYATPPRVTADQVKHFGQALAKGQPDRQKIALTVLADRVREMV